MWLKPKSFHLQWHITERCNFRCRHCYAEKASKELSARELSAVLDQYIGMIRIWELDKGNRPRKLTIGGGEPFLRGDFFGLLKIIKENRGMFTSVGIMSNGSMVSKSIASKLKNHGISGVQISMEGTEKVNDDIRGKGSFKKALRGIANLKEAGVPVGISVTVHKENHGDFSNLLAFLESLGIKSIGVGRLVPAGRGARLGMLEPLEMKRFYERTMTLKKAGAARGMHIHTHCSDSLWFIENRNHETHGCSAGYDSFSILPDGGVVPCRRLPVRVGNVLERSLIDIWYSSDFLWKLRNKGNISACRDCGFFGKCFGGARCVAYGYFNDSFAPDPQCWKLFNALPGKMKFPAVAGNRVVFNEAYTENFNPEKYFNEASDV
jgi:radical SAM protein with 4Fe4S-binding SPASM domain